MGSLAASLRSSRAREASELQARSESSEPYENLRPPKSSASQAGPRVPTPQAREVYVLFAIVVGGSALGSLSQTGVNAMMPAIAADLQVGIDAAQLLTAGYMLTLGIVVPLATFLARRISLRAQALIAAALFVFGSLIDCLAWSFALALAGRLLQAASVGLLMPLLQTIAVTRFPPGRQATAMGVAGIAMGFAPNVGPAVGGALDVAFGWRSFFVLMTVLGAFVMLCAMRFIGRFDSIDSGERFDALSFLLSSLGFGGVLTGTSNASSIGANPLFVWVPLATGALFLVLFVRRQARTPHPLMRLAIFDHPQYNRGLFAVSILSASFMGITLLIPLYAANVRGATSFEAGLVILPSALLALVMNPLAGWLTDRFGVRPVALSMGVLLATGSVLCATAGEATPLFALAAYQTLRGLGVSGLVGPFQSWCLAGLPRDLVPDGSSTSVLARQVSASLGTSALVLIVEVSAAQGVAASFPALPYELAFAFSAALALVVLAFSWARVR